MADSIVGTSNVWPYYSSQNVQTAARKPVKELGKDEFLQILVTQLRNQDPMQPMQDKEFIAQMAQFSSLEQMVNMAQEMTSLRQSAGMAAGLIGKDASWLETTETGTVEYQGTVTSILWSKGVQYAQIGDYTVPISELISLSDPALNNGGAEVAADE